MADILLSRFAIAPDGVFGRLSVGDFTCFTVERPWKGNKNRVSCIPNGIYTLAMRDSPIVAETTKGRFTRGYEVTNVPGRTFIMLHPANWYDQLAGCIAPGDTYGPMWRKSENGYQNGVSRSFDTFIELMDALDYQNEPEHTLDIRQISMEFP